MQDFDEIDAGEGNDFVGGEDGADSIFGGDGDGNDSIFGDDVGMVVGGGDDDSYKVSPTFKSATVGPGYSVSLTNMNTLVTAFPGTPGGRGRRR